MKLQDASVTLDDAGLNPFEIRAGLKRAPSPDNDFVLCLNPFEIRAGLKRRLADGRVHGPGLNPFEIRAGLKQKLAAFIAAVAPS